MDSDGTRFAVIAETTNFLHYFSCLPDHRQPGKVDYPLPEVLLLILLAVLAGADASKIVLVQDNLNTHKPASLYEAFPAAEARRLVERFEWHYTPKHGSWLDMAESELGILASQCLDRRIPDKEVLTKEVVAWTTNRNKHHAKADWQFTTADARIKLKSLYPLI